MEAADNIKNYLYDVLVLLASDCKAIDADGRRSYCATEFKIVSDFGDVQKHLFQVTGDSNLLDREGQITAGDP